MLFKDLIDCDTFILFKLGNLFFNSLFLVAVELLPLFHKLLDLSLWLIQPCIQLAYLFNNLAVLPCSFTILILFQCLIDVLHYLRML